MKKNAIIIGGSTGIGFNFANKLSKLNYDLTIVSNNLQNLNKAKDKILKNEIRTKVKILKFDLTKEKEVSKLITNLSKEKKKYTFMVYCPGRAFYGDHLKIPANVRNEIVKLHIFSYIEIVNFFVSHMIKHGYKSYLVSIGSLSGVIPNPKLLLYAATKKFIHIYSQTLNERLKFTNVKSCLIIPGQTNTLFLKKNNLKNLNKDYLTAQEVVSESLEGIFANKKLIVPGLLNKFRYFLLLILPNFVIQYLYKKK